MKKFVSAAAAVGLFASLAFPASADTTFSDVDDDYWAKDDIDFLVEENIINGFEDGSFRPSEPVKRQQAASMLTQALGLESENNPGYSDIEPDDATYDAIAAVTEAGIFSGKNGEFNPNDSLTRAQMAKVMTVAYDLSGEAAEDYADVDSSHWAYDYVSAVTANGIASGYEEDNTFRPSNETTRAQFAVFMTSALQDDDSEGGEEPGRGDEPERNEEIVQVLEDTLDAQFELDSYTLDGSMDLSMSFPMPEDLTEEEKEMLNESTQMTMDMSGAYQKDPMISEVIMEQTIPGFDETMIMPAIATDTKSYEYVYDAAFMGYPEEWQDKYIEIDYEDLLGEDADLLYDVEKQKEMVFDIYDVLIDNFGTEYFALHDSHESIPEDVSYEQVLSFSIEDEDLKDIITVVEESVIPELEGIFSQPGMASMLGGVTAQEASKLQSEAEADLDAFLDNLDIEAFDVHQAITEDDYIVYDTGNFDISYTDEEGTISFGISYDMAMDNFNEDVTFTYGLPESEDEIITFDEVIEWQEEQLEGIEDFEEVEAIETEE
ncbi:S-layer homology domain-containing protein [Alteribacillus persepolensis]|uniref:S-layer homology domain-containing protein n=1 Tax=Alteribacillus persepolensis TaxID=568899 RepID=A0A1G8H9K0_9BACI|nr:S-layer homology domain-containing protein [Alteribacillus persepolensis]SDI03259.1 S-layer homology domain-containing protein [Alteribacillus persepolensis]